MQHIAAGQHIGHRKCKKEDEFQSSTSLTSHAVVTQSSRIGSPSGNFSKLWPLEHFLSQMKQTSTAVEFEAMVCYALQSDSW